MPRLPFILSLLLFATLAATAQEMRVYTVAGNDTAGYLNDGGPATCAMLSATEGVWGDGSGNIYICDLNGSVRKVKTDGTIVTVAGSYKNPGSYNKGFSGDGGPATNAMLNKPYGIYAADNGDVFIADLDNHRVRKVDGATGIITTVAGGGSVLGDGGPATNAQLYAPYSVLKDNTGNLYIGTNDRIRKVNPSGVITTIAGTGVTGFSGDGGQATAAQVWAASGMVMDKVGNLYFADRSNSRIRKITPSGIITTVVGTTNGYSGDNGPATAARIAGPIGLAMDSLGNILFADNGNNVIRKVNTTTGLITHIAGVNPGSKLEGETAKMTEMHPEFLYLNNKSGTLYYSNWGDRIRKITSYDARYGYGVSVPALQYAEDVLLYPNPAHDVLCIESHQRYNIERMEISDANGRIVLAKTIMPASEEKIDVSGLSPGIYTVRLIDSYSTTIKRFIKN